jgi:hypothetical protein
VIEKKVLIHISSEIDIGPGHEDNRRRYRNNEPRYGRCRRYRQTGENRRSRQQDNEFKTCEHDQKRMSHMSFGGLLLFVSFTIFDQIV